MSEKINIDHIAEYISRAYQEGYNEAYSRVLERVHSELEQFCVFLALRYPAPESAPKNCMMRGDENIKAWIGYMEKCQERGYYDAPAAVTNADRLRAMSDEELADFINSVEAEAIKRAGRYLTKTEIERGKAKRLDWLRQEALE